MNVASSSETRSCLIPRRIINVILGLLMHGSLKALGKNVYINKSFRISFKDKALETFRVLQGIRSRESDSAGYLTPPPPKKKI